MTGRPQIECSADWMIELSADCTVPLRTTLYSTAANASYTSVRRQVKAIPTLPAACEIRLVET